MMLLLHRNLAENHVGDLSLAGESICATFFLNRLFDVRDGFHDFKLKLINSVSKECLGDSDSHLTHVVEVESEGLHGKRFAVLLKRARSADPFKVSNYNLYGLVFLCLLEISRRIPDVALLLN